MEKNIVLILLTILMSCDSKENTSSDKIKHNDIFTSQINYDFENLGIRLNSSIDDTSSNIDWRWDYMNSDNGAPDTTGIDHYMNHNQPVFLFNGEATLPSLSITTDRKKIKRFSSTIIFHLENVESIDKLLDSLTTIDILKDNQVRQSIMEKHEYRAIYKNYIETIELQISDEEYYDRITYEIKIMPHNCI